MKKFYRVENPNTQDGLWYDKNGNFTGLIHEVEFNKLQNHHLKMPFNEVNLGYLCATEDLESLKFWFNDNDLEILKPYGYFITEYESDDYKKEGNHFLINKETSKRVHIHYENLY